MGIWFCATAETQAFFGVAVKERVEEFLLAVAVVVLGGGRGGRVSGAGAEIVVDVLAGGEGGDATVGDAAAGVGHGLSVDAGDESQDTPYEGFGNLHGFFT